MHGDLSTLVANNILDVKSEVVLLRKNILDNVSSIVMKVTSEQQNQFLKRLNDMYTSLNMNYKESLASSVSELYSELSNIRREVDKISMSNKNIVNNVEDFSSSFSELKSVINDLNDFKRKFTATGGIETIGKKFSVIEERLSRVINNNELQIDKFVTVLKNNNEKIDAVLESVSSNKYKHFPNSNFVRDGESSSFVSSKLDERLNKLLLDENDKNVQIPIQKADMREFENFSSSKSLDDDWDNYDLNSVIQIDEKLKKLNSLR